MPVTLPPLVPADIFTSYRPVPPQMQPGYQELPCFVPMAETQFGTGGPLMGARDLPTSPDAPLAPSTLLQVSGTLAHGLWLPAAQPPPP